MNLPQTCILCAFAIYSYYKRVVSIRVCVEYVVRTRILHTDIQMMRIWECNIPLKVKIFLWMAAHDRIQSSVQLKKKQWSGPEKCAVCDQLETTDHILFQCPIAVYLCPP
jgi:hypothetical protein